MPGSSYLGRAREAVGPVAWRSQMPRCQAAPPPHPTRPPPPRLPSIRFSHRHVGVGGSGGSGM
eukprot:2711558-Prymnesium_polylepis.1